MTETENKNSETMSSTVPNKPSYIVGIGASAGGLKALQSFFGALQPETGISYVIIQHLSPDYKSMMTELLSKSTIMPVCQAEDAILMETDHIYLIPPRMNITTMNGRLFLSEQNERQGLNLPIDVFFRSLAEDQGERAIGIILSGTGSDGTRGLRAIKAEGGTVFVQNEESAEFDGMPRCAIATGLADFILPPEKIPVQLLKFINHPRISLPEEPLQVIKKEEDSFAKLFALLKDETKVDFTYYKPATVIRRVERRIGLAQVPGIDEYLDYLVQNPHEIINLFKDLLIGVTKFFRDKEAFNALAKKALPELINDAARRNPPQLRIWDVGCSTGEEAYSIAMLVKDYMDEHEINLDVKLFATDIDQQALEFAGPGTYPESIAADVDVRYLSKFFDKIPGGYRVKKSIRQMVIFAVHNVVNDPPFTKIDLIVCRNLLIYLQSVLQKKIFNTINYILQSDGFLFLGNSETLVSVEDFFEDVDSKHRLYQHRHVGEIPMPAIFTKNAGKEYHYSAARVAYNNRPGNTENGRDIHQEKYYEEILNKVVDTVLVVNETRELTQSFGNTERFLRVPKGRSSLDVLSMLPQELSLALSSAMQKVRKETSKVVYSNIKVKKDDDLIRVKLTVDLIAETRERKNKLYIINIHETENVAESEQSPRIDISDNFAVERIEDLEREVQFTRENLQTTIEELQATNEELLAANEELQSTNEELQSVNEELNTVNAEYQNKVLELTELNTDMDNLMTSSDIPTIFLDKNLYIRKFTAAMTREVNLLEQDIGRPVTDLNIPMFGKLGDDTMQVLNSGKPFIKSISHNDEWFLMRILPFISEKNVVEGVVLTMVRITDQKNAELAWEMQHNLLLTILEESPIAIIMVDREANITFANRHAEKIFGIEKSQLLQMKMDSNEFTITDVDGNPIPKKNQPLELISATEKPLEKYIMRMKTLKGAILVVNVNANPTFDKKKQVNGAVLRIDLVAYE